MLWLLALPTLVGCQGVAPISGPIAFTFENRAHSTIVAVAVHNTGHDVVFLPRCGEHMLPAIERRTGDAWINAAAAICPANERMDPIRLAAGEVHQDTIGVRQPGTYRLRVMILRGSMRAASEPVVSQGFEVD